MFSDLNKNQFVFNVYWPERKFVQFSMLIDLNENEFLNETERLFIENII